MQKEDRRVQKTKMVIKTALLDLMKKKDFAQITINDIAEKANINRGTVYFHYEDKYDLLYKVMEQELQELKNVCEPISGTATTVELAIYFTAVYQFFDDNYDFFSLMLQNGATNHFREMFQTLVLGEMLKISEANNSALNKEFAIHFKVSALVGVVEWWIQEDHTLSVDEMAANTMELFLRNK